jgi:hypothetical protein
LRKINDLDLKDGAGDGLAHTLRIEDHKALSEVRLDIFSISRKHNGKMKLFATNNLIGDTMFNIAMTGLST